MIIGTYKQNYWYRNLKENYRKIIVIENFDLSPTPTSEATQKFELPPEAKKSQNSNSSVKCILSEGKKQNCFQGSGKAKGSWCARRPFSASTYKRHLYWPQPLGAQDYCQESDMNIIIWCSSDCYWLWDDPHHSETNFLANSYKRHQYWQQHLHFFCKNSSDIFFGSSPH